MRNLVLFMALILVIGAFTPGKNHSSTNYYKSPTKVKIPKEITDLTGELSYVPSGILHAGLTYHDSVWIPETTVSIQSFYMSRNEITNKQYRTFCEDILATQGKDSADKIWQDTTCFAKYFPNGNMEAYDKHYFSNDAYDDYPVVGINWNQAIAYCKWVNNKLDEIYKEHPDWKEKYAMNQVRIPTELEWEYAAKGVYLPESRSPLFTWGNSFNFYDEKYSWPENIGQIKDENGILIKDYSDDGAYATAASYTFQPNSFGLFHMSGNVSEWMADTYRDVSVTGHDLGLSTDNDSIKMVKKKSYYNNLYSPVKSGEQKVIKGGNFLDGPAWCLNGNRRGVLPNEQHSYIGFRVVSTFYYKAK